MPRILLPTLLLVPAILAASPPDADARIAASARNSYNFRVHLRGDSIQVTSHAGAVTLSGTVANELHRSLAEDTVKGLPGVASVDNRLTLKAETAATPPDLWLVTRVKTALRYHRSVDDERMHVSARDGVVTLSGQAGSSAEKALAQDIAENLDGVKEVKNDLQVASPGKKPLALKIDDASVTAQVKAVLLAHRGTHMLATRVKTDRGVVTLRGEARNRAEKDLAARLASGVRGARRIRNLMSVAS